LHFVSCRYNTDRALYPLAGFSIQFAAGYVPSFYRINNFVFILFYGGNGEEGFLQEGENFNPASRTATSKPGKLGGTRGTGLIEAV